MSKEEAFDEIKEILNSEDFITESDMIEAIDKVVEKVEETINEC